MVKPQLAGETGFREGSATSVLRDLTVWGPSTVRDLRDLWVQGLWRKSWGCGV